MSDIPHIPVLLNEVLEYLDPKPGQTYIDGTFGAGGYSRAILEKAGCNLVAFDRDDLARDLAKSVQENYKDRFKFIAGNFGDMEDLVPNELKGKIAGMVFDIGLSSMQLADRERGFSFNIDAPLDMRMGSSGMTAADVVNNTKEEELADIIYLYGEEKDSRRVARMICRAREIAPIATTFELKEAIYAAKGKYGKIDPATKTFQALRIYVNDELGELTKVLDSAKRLLAVGGRLVVVTFHSLEDRIVKNFLAENTSKPESRNKYKPLEEKEVSLFKVLTKKPIAPSEDEVRANSRSRSAKLRAAVKMKEELL